MFHRLHAPVATRAARQRALNTYLDRHPRLPIVVSAALRECFDIKPAAEKQVLNKTGV